MPDVVDNTEPIKIARLLGVVFSDNLNFDEHGFPRLLLLLLSIFVFTFYFFSVLHFLVVVSVR